MAELPAWILEQAEADELRSLTAVHDALVRMTPPFDVPAGLAPPVRRRRRSSRFAWLAVPAAAAAVFAPERLSSVAFLPNGQATPA